MWVHILSATHLCVQVSTYRRVSNLSNACRSFITPSAPIKRAHTANKTIAQPRARALALKVRGSLLHRALGVRLAGRGRHCQRRARRRDEPHRAAQRERQLPAALHQRLALPAAGCAWRQGTQTSVNNRNKNKIIIGIKPLQQGDQMIAHVADKTVRSVA